MSPMSQIVQLLVSSLGGLALLLLWLRFLLQLVGADFYNPASQGVVRFTDPILKPLRQIMPRSRYYDWSALVAIVLVKLVMLKVLVGNELSPETLVLATVLSLLWLATEFFFWLLLINVVLSWISLGYHPMAALINQLVEPVLAPFRKILPPMSGFDLSPILAFLAIQVIQILLGSISVH